MTISHRLKIWAFIVLLDVASSADCPATRCTTVQLGTPEYVTRVLQCNGDGQSCQKAIFDSSPKLICLMRVGDGKVRIYLHNCADFNINTGYFITDAAGILPSGKGWVDSHAVFEDVDCPSNCNNIKKTMYKANGKTLVADDTQAVTRSGVKCNEGLYVYPKIDAVGACGLVGDVGAGGNVSHTFKRRCPWQTQKRVLLTITDGESAFAIGAPEFVSVESYRLPIVDELNGEVFYAQEYDTHAVGANGTIEYVTAYTLQLAKAKKYLVADVLDDTTLNYAGYYSTGLNVKDASEFPRGYAREPDYRLFLQYNVTIYSQNATVFCPLFHRNYCLCSGVSGYLRLTPLRSADRSVKPTFVNPTDDELRHFILYSQPTETERFWHVKLRVL